MVILISFLVSSLQKVNTTTFSRVVKNEIRNQKRMFFNMYFKYYSTKLAPLENVNYTEYGISSIHLVQTKHNFPLYKFCLCSQNTKCFLVGITEIVVDDVIAKSSFSEKFHQ